MAVLCGASTAAEPPKIDLIELWGTDLILIHFETAAGRSYVLQYADAVCFRVAGLRGHVDCTVWKALFTVPVLPFPNHYVIADRRVGGHRIYRLQVTP